MCLSNKIVATVKLKNMLETDLNCPVFLYFPFLFKKAECQEYYVRKRYKE